MKLFQNCRDFHGWLGGGADSARCRHPSLGMMRHAWRGITESNHFELPCRNRFRGQAIRQALPHPWRKPRIRQRSRVGDKIVAWRQSPCGRSKLPQLPSRDQQGYSKGQRASARHPSCSVHCVHQCRSGELSSDHGSGSRGFRTGRGLVPASCVEVHDQTTGGISMVRRTNQDSPARSTAGFGFRGLQSRDNLCRRKVIFLKNAN